MIDLTTAWLLQQSRGQARQLASWRARWLASKPTRLPPIPVHRPAAKPYLWSGLFGMCVCVNFFFFFVLVVWFFIFFFFKRLCYVLFDLLLLGTSVEGTEGTVGATPASGENNVCCRNHEHLFFGSTVVVMFYLSFL